MKLPVQVLVVALALALCLGSGSGAASDLPLPPNAVSVEVTDVIAREDGRILVVTDQDVNWHVTSDTPIYAARDGSLVSMDKIVVGMKLKGWYAIQTNSFPAQASPLRIVVMEDEGA